MRKNNTNKEIGQDLTKGPIFQSLLIFSLPVILTNVIQQLYGMVDLAIAGNYVGAIGTVGVNTGGEMADLVLPIAIGIETAGQIYIAQSTGAGSHEKIGKTVSTLFTFAITLSILLAVIVVLFCNPILHLLNCPEDAFEQARAYMIITTIGFPFVFGYNAVCGLLRGMGESVRPMLFIIIAAIINIFADLLFVAGFHLEAMGTAIATVLSQLGSFIAAFSFLYRQRKKLGINSFRELLNLDIPTLSVLVRLAAPQVARSMLVRVGMLYINANVNAYGTEISAVNGVGNRIQKFLEVFMQGVDTGSSTMIGQNLGARKQERAKNVTWCTFAMTMIMATIISIIGVIWSKQIFGLFSNDEIVKNVGIVYMQFMVIHFYCSAFVGAFQAMVTGCGFVSLGFAIGILDGLVCKIGLSILFLPLFNHPSGIFAFFCSEIPQVVTDQVIATPAGSINNFGYLAYFLGIACSRFLPGLLCFGYFISGNWKHRKLLTESTESKKQSG